jgi:hypothetical protein
MLAPQLQLRTSSLAQKQFTPAATRSNQAKMMQHRASASFSRLFGPKIIQARSHARCISGGTLGMPIVTDRKPSGFREPYKGPLQVIQFKTLLQRFYI